MSDFFDRLASRQLQGTGVVPRLPSRFDSMADGAPVVEAADDVVPARTAIPGKPSRDASRTRWLPLDAAPADAAPAVSGETMPLVPPSRLDRGEPGWAVPGATTADAGGSLPLATPRQPGSRETVRSSTLTVDEGEQTTSAGRDRTGSTASPAVPPMLEGARGEMDAVPRVAVPIPPGALVPTDSLTHEVSARVERQVAPRPSVRITIGRLEVRALVEPKTTRPETYGRRSSTMSLDEYLERRHGARL
jgi:hypothetical protein